MNEIGSRKVFDRTLYEIADRDAKAATLKYITLTFGFKKVDGVWKFPDPPAGNEAGVTISDSATVSVNRKESL